MTDRMRRLEASDLDALVEIYRQAVLTSTDAFYTTAQQSAWASQCEAIRPILQRGQGFVSCNSSNQPMAFCLRDPADRIALLYSHPAMQRSGLGGMLLAACEDEASQQGVTCLRTEASLISHVLFQARGWQVSWREELLIAGVHFLRFRMQKQLVH